MVSTLTNLQVLIAERKVLPITKRIKTNIDKLYIQYVGPVGATLCEDYFSEWKANGNIGPGDLVQYIKLLSVDIPSPLKRDEFERSSVKLIRLID